MGPAQKLEALSKLINPAIGDAISDLLAVVAVLTSQGTSIGDMSGMYQVRGGARTTALLDAPVARYRLNPKP